MKLCMANRIACRACAQSIAPQTYGLSVARPARLKSWLLGLLIGGTLVPMASAADYGLNLDPTPTLAERGLTIKFDWTQHLHGVVDGRAQVGPEWGSRLDTIMTLDGGRAGLWRGLYIDAEIHTRLGQSINSSAGTVLPVNFDLSFPADGEPRVAVPILRVRQQVTDDLTVFLGRAMPLPGYVNEFSDGLGKSKFIHTALVAKPVMSGSMFPSAYTLGMSYRLVAPAAPLDRGTTFKVLLQDANDVYSKSGFDTLFRNGYSVLLELFSSHRIFGLPGQQTVNFTWSTKSRTSLDLNDAVILPSGGIAAGQKDRTWAAWYGFDQYFWYDPTDTRRRFGAFGQFSFSDGNPNPIHWFYNIGLGGSGPFEARPEDRWGAGYFHASFSDVLKQSLIDALDLKLTSERGFEAFYSFSLGSGVHLTAALQHVKPAFTTSDWVTLGVFRLRTQF